MQAYIYCAALYCQKCGEKICATMHKPAHVNVNDESSYDSDDFPKGPYPNGGGESDSPEHCDSCHCFLENPLTPDGVNYTRQLISENPRNKTARIWRDFYMLSEV
jgi:hypothetical protein